MLHKTLSSLNNHLGNPLMVLRQLVKGGINHFHVGPFYGLLNIRNLLGTLVNQKDNQVHFRGVALYGLSHVL